MRAIYRIVRNSKIPLDSKQSLCVRSSRLLHCYRQICHCPVRPNPLTDSQPGHATFLNSSMTVMTEITVYQGVPFTNANTSDSWPCWPFGSVRENLALWTIFYTSLWTESNVLMIWSINETWEQEWETRLHLCCSRWIKMHLKYELSKTTSKCISSYQLMMSLSETHLTTFT